MPHLFDQVLIEKQYVPAVTAYYYKQWKHYEMQDHTHPSMEIMYVIEGQCFVEIGERQTARKSISLKKGEFIFLDGEVPHRLLVEASCRMLNVEFGFTSRKGTLPSLRQLADDEPILAQLLQCPASYLVLREPHNIYYVLKSLVMELDGSRKRELMVQLLLAELLLRIAELYRNFQSDSEPGKERYVRKAMEFIYEYYDQEITVADVASVVNLHPSYLQKIFKQMTSQSILEFLNIHRVEKAKMFLQQTDIPMVEIADFVGVSSRQYFHYIFKKQVGMTPLAYRKAVVSQKFASKESYQFN